MKKIKIIDNTLSIWQDKLGYRIQDNGEFKSTLYATLEDALECLHDSTIDMGAVKLVMPLKKID